MSQNIDNLSVGITLDTTPLQRGMAKAKGMLQKVGGFAGVAKGALGGGIGAALGGRLSGAAGSIMGGITGGAAAGGPIGAAVGGGLAVISEGIKAMVEGLTLFDPNLMKEFGLVMKDMMATFGSLIAPFARALLPLFRAVADSFADITAGLAPEMESFVEVFTWFVDRFTKELKRASGVFRGMGQSMLNPSKGIGNMLASALGVNPFDAASSTGMASRGAPRMSNDLMAVWKDNVSKALTGGGRKSQVQLLEQIAKNTGSLDSKAESAQVRRSNNNEG